MTAEKLMRNTLLAWYAANDKEKWLDKSGDWKTRTFNTIDLTKSYLASTRKGIVLDAKVGPSEHLIKYIAKPSVGVDCAFIKYFVSYSRGGKTAGVPENQLIGTFNSDDAMRKEYADKFASKMLVAESSEENWGKMEANNGLFNQLTSYHGQGWTAADPHIDTATTLPAGVDAADVAEIGGTSKGPFRVYKKASDQTNQSVGQTTEEEIKNLCKDTVSRLLKKVAGKYFNGDCGDKKCFAKATALIE